MIETNTFGANRFRLERHGLVGEVRNFNLAGARIAREVAGEGVNVAGPMGPSGLVPGVASKAELVERGVGRQRTPAGPAFPKFWRGNARYP